MSIYPAISIARIWKKQAATGNGWEWGDGRRREPQEAATRLAIYTPHAKMSGAISEIPLCRFPVLLECHCTRLLPPPPLLLSAASKDLSSVSSSSRYVSVLLIPELIANRHPRCNATWSWHGALKISPADIRFRNSDRNQVTRMAFNFVSICLCQIEHLYVNSLTITQRSNLNNTLLFLSNENLCYSFTIFILNIISKNDKFLYYMVVFITWKWLCVYVYKNKKINFTKCFIEIK